MTIELDAETEVLITTLAVQEKTSAAQLIKKVLVNYFESKKQPELLTDFAGLLAGSPSFKGNPLDVQKAMRDENDGDFFSCAGIWKDSEVSQESIRDQAWKRVGHDSV